MYKLLIIKMLGVIFIAMVGVHYLLYLKTGRMPDNPLGNFSLDSVSLPKVNLPFISSESGAGGTSLSDKPVYTWRDENGVLHFSESAPEGGNASQFHSDKPVNIVPAVNVPPRQDGVVAPRAGRTVESEGASAIDKALDARDLLEQRQAEQQKVLDRL
ncbi:DUF4124 domain-containing protein [Cellvibrio polysaccharolyticus]|uniref:DUF4124 domain-containing protein n=1 Tax=Cellvibrio polysaccharolyticus TaxID=2082724 RepID=A0A928V1B5_9GAMM|nr:DUF4124 domain-containing protein [Cellvibrio polysaccharolyticus]MBE8716965.1 DUF4124 domain-containing protein [Cellvibrio polysaccharolyticus]